MSLTIDLTAELEHKLEAEARRQGVTTDALARNILEEKLEQGEGFGSPVVTRVLASNLPIRDRQREAEWLRNNRNKYAGQWVALDGDTLIASGQDLKQVAQAARRSGVPDALMMHVEPSDALPFAGF